jgi:LPS-assembly lipoprotein
MMAQTGASRVRAAAGALMLTLCTGLTVSLSGCGFHLEGRTPLPAVIHTPYLQASDLQSDFVQSLQKALLISGARPTDQRGTASAVVNIVRDEVTRRVLSVSGDKNQPNEYEVTYNVRFSVSAGDRELLAVQDVAASRSYSFNESLLLAKEHEEEILRQAMAHDLADIVMRQLSRL